MRSILMAAGLALILHGLLFALYPDWGKERTFRPFKPEPMNISISYKKKETPLPPPVEKLVEVQRQPPPVKEVPPKKVVEKKPVQKTEKIPEKITPLLEPKEETRPPAVPDRAPSQAEPALQEQVLEVSEEETRPAPRSSPEEDRTASLPPPPPSRAAFPVYQKNPPPVYPRLARRRGYEGTVVLEVLVNRLGKVDELRLFQSSGYGVLDRAAVTAVKSWLFEPGMRGDEKVDMWVKIPVRFRLE
ncbi:MAG: energy transducer TonB [Proteobacteria bacterium]|nr:energy transducer TonB [Pseudomonadota bacterium]